MCSTCPIFTYSLGTGQWLRAASRKGILSKVNRMGNPVKGKMTLLFVVTLTHKRGAHFRTANIGMHASYQAAIRPTLR